MPQDLQAREIIARKFLDSDTKYKGYEITTNQHTEHTNVDTIQAKVDNLTVTLLIDHHTGAILHKSESRAYERTLVEPHIAVHDVVHRVHTHKSEKRKKVPLSITIGLTVIGALIAAIPDTKWIGVVISLVFGALSFYTGKHAFEKETTIDRA
jgi:hypothetical protein